jgi:hypothetical protein
MEQAASADDQVHPGHKLIKSNELKKGQQIAWAACALWGVKAMIIEGEVMCEASPGNWVKFDAENMLRSLILGHVPAVLVPDEIA